MADNLDVLRVGNPKLDGGIEEPNRGGMSRRAFIRLMSYLATWVGLLGYSGYIGYSSYKARGPKSIDDYANPTDVMLDRLSNVTIDDVNVLGVENTNTYSKVSAVIEDPNIIQQYLVTYYFLEYSPLGDKTLGHETMAIELTYPTKIEEDKMSPIDIEGHRRWCFRGKGPLDANDFSYHIFRTGNHDVIQFEQGVGKNAVINIRNLLDIDGHIQKRRAQKPI